MEMNNTITKEIPDGWSSDGQTFITGGIGYRIRKDLAQCCIGLVDADGEPLIPLPKGSETSQDNKNGVAKIPEVSGEGCQSFVTINECKVVTNENIKSKNTLETLQDAPQSKFTCFINPTQQNGTARIKKQQEINPEKVNFVKIISRRGRPPKFGANSKTTLWRRAEKLQGVLL